MLVQGLQYNLLNISQLNNLGHKLKFEKRKVKIFNDEGNLIGPTMQIKGNLFYLDSTIQTCLFARIEYVWLSSKRLFHVNFENMMKISEKKRVITLPNLQRMSS